MKTAAMTLPPSYLEARARLAKREIPLDWRKLGSRKPPMWPGMICMFTEQEAERDNARLQPMFEGAPPFFIGSNAAGILFAIDPHDRVVVVDEIEMEFPEVLAENFDAFELAFAL